MGEPIPVMLMVRELGIGGCERDLTKLAKAIDRSKFEPHVACFHSEGLRSAELRTAGVPIVRFPVRSFKSFSALSGGRLMGRYLAQHKIKVVHCFDVPTVLFGVPVARFFRTPAVISAQLGFRDLFPRSYQRLLRFSDGLADTVVTNSKAVQRSLIELDNVPAERTFLCYNGVETAMFHPGTGRRPTSIPEASLVIGTVCALRTEKRLDLLVKAFTNVRRLQAGIKLLIVGSGPVLPELKQLSRDLDVAADCIFEPAQTDVAEWMRAIDVFVMCSESESFPNALLEAMASGCAAVGSRVGGVPELITDGETGLLFESQNVEALSETLTTLITDTELRKRLAQNAVISAQQVFSMETNARRNEELYRMILERKGYSD